MTKLKDFTGLRFRRLVVIQRVQNFNGKVKWLCKCDCGNVIEVLGDNLRSKHTQSCGCITTKHNLAHKENLYWRWIGMKERCNNPNASNYKNYGAKGVKVCKEWTKNYLLFRNWAIENGYKKELTLDRINPEGDYEPSNCRWVTWKIQNNNKRKKERYESKTVSTRVC